jgi:predicted nucleotidyltransferase
MSLQERELSMMLFNKLKHQFPEIELVGITESMETSDEIWVKIVLPEDEDREIALYELAGQISTDILMQYGSHITIIAAPNVAKNLVQAV